MVPADLSSLVWRERRALDGVLFALQTVRLHLEHSGERWLDRTLDQLRLAVDALRVATLERTVMSTADGERSLRELAATAAAPLDGILAEHRAAMRERVREIDAERTRVLTLLTVRETTGATAPSTAVGPGPDVRSPIDPHAGIDADLSSALAAQTRVRARLALTDLVPSELGDLLH
ncbi:hypothetical protein BKD30_11245 [Tersicoccus phoenicis]|uniref:Uncharacterized protein n=1 Tax=Tersicoccus phoenicis TaxID=554083 RepID=A0A1R1L7J4_9MICC|nr:hypothetical protein [Tersicoccus phoenicis]OMH23508.1 hypothetical protein BKD30_11245 [Tersicoccus phoenicis]